VEADIELPYEEVTLRTVSNEDTSRRLSQKIDETYSETPLDSGDTSSRKHESLDKVASNKPALQQNQADQQEPQFGLQRNSEQQHKNALPEEQERKEQQSHPEEQPQTIGVIPDKKPEPISEKKESSGFFRGLFGKKNKYIQDPEKDFRNDIHTIESSQKDLTSSVESEKKSETKNIIGKNEKKTKGQNKDEEEIVYLTDEDIEDLLK
jgi:fused signal recognition particle receptor